MLAGLVQLMGEDQAFDYMKELDKNSSKYTRSGQAQAPNVAKGEVTVGISFIFGFEGWRYNKYPIKTAAPCEGTSYEVGGIALVRGRPHGESGQRYYDWLLGPAGQASASRADSLQVPANASYRRDERIPGYAEAPMRPYDFARYGQNSERQRLLTRWTNEVQGRPR